MKVLVLTRLAKGYGLLLTMAGGGLAFANIFGVVATAIQGSGERAPDTTPIKTSMHIGWIFGVGIALLGAVMEWRKRRAKAAVDSDPLTIAKQTKQTKQTKQSSSKRQRRGLLVSAGWGGFFGVVLGAALGASFVLLWFSITYSPLAPREWVSSVSVERQRLGTSGREDPVMLSNHPVVVYAFGLPVALGAVGGAVFGSVVRVTDEE
ncbi:MAG: hypothetical protein ABJZ55_11955 [Fuerstiella sp.]